MAEVVFTEGQDEDLLDEDLDLDGGAEDVLGVGVDAEEEETEEGVEDGDGEEVEGEEESPEELILGKFKTPEDLAKAYTELEKRLGAAPKGGSLKLGQPKQETPATGGEAEAVDFTAVDRDLAASGEVSAETYEALAAKNISRAAVDRYARGVRAEAENMRSSLAELAGGEEELPKVLEWARKNLTENERNLFDSLVDSQNVDAVRLAMGGILMRYQKATDGEGGKIVRPGGKPATSSGLKPFSSFEEYADATADPRYDRDPKHRAKVDARMRISKF